MELIRNRITESMQVKQKILESEGLLLTIDKASQMLIDCYRKKQGRVFFAGNGGSAADAQHLAAELVSKFYLERKGLAAEALNVNTSIITAISNDYHFDRIYARQLEANASPGDVFIGLSTSGNSSNILEALTFCRNNGIKTIGFTGESGGKMNGLCDLLVNVPAKDTPRIQEAHIMIGHIICEIVEKELFGNA